MWRIHRHHILKDMYGTLQKNQIVAVEHDWTPTFAILPHRTISKKYVWLKKIYVRRVWIYTGFIDEPETQYGELFDILKESNG